ncbi:MAG: 5'-methylthioadenosine/S-adenosylhomocysteine nucleosidase [Clostridia bacterium]|nr:5'-methylthioadenosine/S-adenosylhomocysteine nucleosidase [Clostridia bacterium]
MKIGVLFAGDKELAPFLPMINDIRETQKAMLTIYEGMVEGVEVATLFSGVCKVNAAVATQILVDCYGCEAVINAGTAGGMDERLELFDTVVSTEVAYHDVAPGILTEFHPWLDSVYFKADEKLLNLAKQVAGERTFFGRMVTGEQFIVDEKRPEINARFAPLSVDMETAAVAHTCHVNGIPFLAVRTLTDTAKHSGDAAFQENCAKASAISADFVRRMLRAKQD